MPTPTIPQAYTSSYRPQSYPSAAEIARMQQQGQAMAGSSGALMQQMAGAPNSPPPAAAFPSAQQTTAAVPMPRRNQLMPDVVPIGDGQGPASAPVAPTAYRPATPPPSGQGTTPYSASPAPTPPPTASPSANQNQRQQTPAARPPMPAGRSAPPSWAQNQRRYTVNPAARYNAYGRAMARYQ